MLIENYIPFGYKNRISRESLEILTRHKDRTNREEIADALLLRGVLIINIDGGYFRSDGSPEDKKKEIAYYRQERSRSKSCDKRCDAIWDCIKPHAQDDITKNQIDLSMFGIGGING